MRLAFLPTSYQVSFLEQVYTETRRNQKYISTIYFRDKHGSSIVVQNNVTEIVAPRGKIVHW